MNHLYIMGGQQKAPRALTDVNQAWNGYGKGLIVELNPMNGESRVVNEYGSPPPLSRSSDGAVLFQAGTMEECKIYLCTQTEVMVYSIPDFTLLSYISLPSFNDLHHVRPARNGNLLVANAGLEMVMELTRAGDIVRVWNVLGEDPWEHFSPTVDYRSLSTKPHRSHPNYLFYIGDELWATRFHQGDAIALNNPSRRIKLTNERVHDGLVHGERVYFTAVSGNIIVANASTLEVEQIIDLNTMHPEGMLLGWCRALYLDDDKLWVGFSRIRPTKFRENVGFVMRGFKRSMPTHIACYDLTERRCLVEFNLEPVGLSAIYSIFPSVAERATA